MFEIKFRIVDDISELRTTDISYFENEIKHISGFFQMRFGEHTEGSYYHESVLGDDEVGGELLDYWFLKLLAGVNSLKNGSSYVAIKEIETINRWIEFKRYRGDIAVNVAIDEKSMIKQLVLTEPPTSFTYKEPFNYILEWDTLKNCVTMAANRFLTELYEINPELIHTQMGLQFRMYLERLSR